MLQQHGFHFHRGNVFAAAANHVFLAVDKVQIAIGIAAHHIAGMKPAVGPGLLRGGFVFQVTGKKAVTGVRPAVTHQQFGVFVHTGILARVIHQFHLNLGLLPAETTGANVAGFMVGDDHCAGARFGHGPGFQQRKTKAFFERLMQAAIDAGAKTETHVVLGVLHRGLGLHQYGGHDAQIVNDRGFRFAHRVPPGTGVKAVEHDEAAPCRDHGQGGAGHGIHVYQRQGRQHALFACMQGCHAADRGIPVATVQIVFVGQNAALGAPGGARGIQQAAFRLCVDFAAVQGGGAIGLRNGVVGSDQCQPPAGLLRCVGQAGVPLRQCHGQADFRMADQISELGGPHVGVNGYNRYAQRIQGKPMQEKRRPVFQQQANTVPMAVARVAVGQFQRIDLVQCRLVRDFTGRDVVMLCGFRHDAQERIVRPLGSRLAKRFVNRFCRYTRRCGIHFRHDRSYMKS